MTVVTFHGFERGEERLLARQVEVARGQREPGPRLYLSVGERRQALRKYLTRKGYMVLFDRVHTDLREHLPDRVWQEPGKRGIGFQLPEPNGGAWKTYFGIQAGYLGAVCRVSILPQAIHWGENALERLRETVKLSDWTHGGYAFAFASEEEWDKLRPDVLEFVKAVMANRLGTGEDGT